MTPSSPKRIVGVRCFRLDRDPPALRSVFVDYRYDRRKVKNARPPREGGHTLRAARVKGARDSRPLLDERGFYAAKPGAMTDVLVRMLRERPRSRPVKACGLVRLFGRVVEHELGYRAQGLLLDRLAVLKPEVQQQEVGRLEERYGVPVDRPKGGRPVRRAHGWVRFWLDEMWGIEIAA